jgi:glycerol-3-phosphate dehydrogenase
MNDLAGATSSASGKLIHGGLRYLEYYQFRLVREALAECEVLLHIAPKSRATVAIRVAPRQHHPTGLAGPAGFISVRPSGPASQPA